MLTFCHTEQLTPISKSLHFNALYNLIEQVFHVLLTNEQSLKYNQNDRFAFFFKT